MRNPKTPEDLDLLHKSRFSIDYSPYDGEPDEVGQLAEIVSILGERLNETIEALKVVSGRLDVLRGQVPGLKYTVSGSELNATWDCDWKYCSHSNRFKGSFSDRNYMLPSVSLSFSVEDLKGSPFCHYCIGEHYECLTNDFFKDEIDIVRHMKKQYEDFSVNKQDLLWPKKNKKR